MNKIINKTIAISILSMVLFAANSGAAKASVLDWFSSTGPNLEFAYSSMSQHSQSANDQIADSNPALVQSTSLMASAVTVSSKNLKTTKFSQSWSEEMSVLATGYSSTPDQTDDSPFIMANGRYVHDGAIAANIYINGKKIPLGTLVKIPELYGNRIFVVEDRMNSRYTNNIDLWFADRSSALNFGAKRVKIQIVNS
jgi:3D (Asp-Asp-Asp) domain-containing protein